MFVALILGLLAVVALAVLLLQRSQSRKSHRATYFSQTLGISDPATKPAPVPSQAEDEGPRLL